MRKIITLLFILLIMLPVYIPNAVTQEISRLRTDKIVAPQRVLEGNTVEVTIKLTGEGSIAKSEVDVVLILDRSGSMGGSKIADAQQAAKGFLDFTNELDRVSFISYSKDIQIRSDLLFMNSTNKGILRAEIDSYKIKAEGTTNIYDAIDTANELLLKSPRENVLLVEILLTDGRHNYPAKPEGAFESLANYAKDNDIAIYTVGLGSDVNPDRLEMIANVTSGKYYFAPTSGELEGIFAEIAKSLAIAGTEIVVSETIPYYLSYNNDSSIIPDETDENSDTILKWDVGTLWIEDEWNVTYTAQADRAVDLSNQVSHTQIKYVTAEGNPVTINLVLGLVFHDIAVTRLTAEPARVNQGDLCQITATVESKGIVTDTFNVEMRLDDALLSSQTLTLEPEQSNDVSLAWNTSDTPKGKYQIAVTADPNEIIWEQDRSDNTAETNVEISTAGLSFIFLTLFFLLFLILASSVVAGTYYSKRAQKSIISPAITTCPRCGSSLIYNSRIRRWYCARCRRTL